MTVGPESLSSMLTSCLGFASQMLEDSGAFYPFAAVVQHDGIIGQVGFWNGEEHPSPGEIYAQAVEALQNKAASGEILAAALAVNVDIPSEFSPAYPDGIRVQVESADYSRLVYLPYRISRVGLLRRTNRLEAGEMFAVEAPHALFHLASGDEGLSPSA